LISKIVSKNSRNILAFLANERRGCGEESAMVDEEGEV